MYNSPPRWREVGVAIGLIGRCAGASCSPQKLRHAPGGREEVFVVQPAKDQIRLARTAYNSMLDYYEHIQQTKVVVTAMKRSQAMIP